MDDEGFDEHHSTTVPAKVFMTWSEDQRSELALQLLLSVSSHSLASVTNRLAPLLQKDFVSLLPVELSIHILSYTDARTLGRAARVCRKWRALASENSSWKSSYFRNGWTVNENYLDKLLFQLGFHTSKVPCTSQSHSSSISSLSLQIAASSPAASSSVYPCNTCISENNDLQTVDTCLQFFQNNSDPLASSSLRSTASKLSLPISGLSLPLSQWNPLDSRWSATHQDLTFSTSIGLLNSIDDNCGGSEANNHYTPTTLLSSQNLDTSQAYQASSRHGNNMAPVNCFGSSWKGKQALFTGSTSSLTNDPPASSTGLSMLSTSYAIPVSPNHHPLSSRTHRSDFTNFEDESLSLGDINSPTPHTLGVSLGSNMFGSPNPNTLSSSINAIESKLSNFSMQLPQHNLTNLMGTSSLYSANITSLDRYKHLDWKHIYHQRFLLSRNWRDGIYTARNINAHDEAIYCLQFDEDKIISGSRDDTIKVWDMKSGVCVNTLVGHMASVLCLQYNHNTLISGSSDSTIIVWDLKSCKIIRRLHGHTESVLNLRFNDSVIVSCSKDKTIKVWDTQTGELLRTLHGHRAAINAIQFENGLIVSASGDRTIKIWQMSTGLLIRTLSGHTRGIACVQFDGNIIVSGSSDKTIKVWDAHTGFQLYTLTGHKDLVRTLQFDQHRIVSGSYDETIKVWDIHTGTLLHELVGGHSSRVFKLQFNDSKVVSCSQDQHIIVWDYSQGIDTRYFCR